MKISSLTDIGVQREMNQDYLYASDEPVGKLANLFLVADGMGGHKAGEFASRFTVETVVDAVRRSEEDGAAKILAEAVRTANRLLKEYADDHREMQGMGTTVVAATVEGSSLTVANVGDSRLYLVEEEQIRQVTRDHSLVQEMVRLGEMDAESAKHHPDKNIITRAVGVDQTVEVDFFEERLQPGQRILLCSDGLTNMVDDDVIRRTLAGEEDLEKKTEALMELANKNGGKDNITVIVVEPDIEVAEC